MQVQSPNPYLQAQANSKYQSAAQTNSSAVTDTKAATASQKAATVGNQYAAAAKASETAASASTAGTKATAADGAVSISKAAKQMAQNQPQHASAIYRMDTSAGSRPVNLDDYFSMEQSKQDTYSAPISLVPSLANVKAMTSHVGAGMKDLLQSNGIAQAPASITFDDDGNMQVPDDYQYKAQLTEALNKDPSMVKELRTLDALANIVGGVQATESAEASKAGEAQTASTANDVGAQILFSASGAVSVSANNHKVA